MSNDEPTTQSTIEVAPVVDPPSWHAPVKALDGRVTKLEIASVLTSKKLDAIESKTDTLTIMIGEIRGAVVKAAGSPLVKAAVTALILAFFAWLSRNGVKVEIPQ